MAVPLLQRLPRRPERLNLSLPVGEDDDVRQMTTGENGTFSSMQKEAIFIDNTTASADVAREIYATATAAGLHFIDAPAVRRSGWCRKNGKLTVMCGGDEGGLCACRAVDGMLWCRVTLMGASGRAS